MLNRVVHSIESCKWHVAAIKSLVLQLGWFGSLAVWLFTVTIVIIHVCKNDGDTVV